MTQRIGKYEIQAEIGRGGFGRVYKGYDPTVGRVVAIKVLLPDANDPEFLTRFKMEATTAGNLHHPNLVTIHEFGEDNGSQFLVMEYLEGEDLQKLIKEHRPIPILDKMEIMQQVAAGLHCAHENNVIHRDVKPSNVMVMRDNLVKLMDFGIARLTRNDTTRMTKAGFLVGTLNYMSPEQFRDAEVDALCDIWAFGVIYYEFVTGRFPFEGTSTPAILYSITSVDPPAPSSLVPDCPEALSHMIMKALSKDRDLRYQSLQEFQLDAGPILLEMRRQRANQLIPEARALFEQEKGEEAQRVVRRILDLDPMHAEARQLRERIQKMAQRQAVIPRIEQFKKTGQEQMAQQRFAEAIQSFESALKLDAGNAEIQALLDAARGSVGKYKEAQELAEKAAALADRQEFEAAHEVVKKALQVDPGNRRAREVMTRVQHAFDSQGRRREVEELVARAQEMVGRGAFDEAIGLLSGARARLYDPPEVLAGIEQAEAAKKAAAERQRRQRAVAEADALLAKEQVDEAEALLEPFRAAADEDAALGLALARCAEVRRMLERRQAVELVTRRTRTLQQDGELERAVALVERAIQEFPGEPALESLLVESKDLIRQRDNRRAIDQILRKARDLRSGGDPGAARKVLTEAIGQYGEVPALVALSNEIGADLSAREARKAAQIVADEVRGLAARGEWEAASGKLREALKKFPAEPELTALSESVERGLREDKTRKERDAGIAAARATRQKGDLAKALLEVTALREKFGDWPALAELAVEIESEQYLREKRDGVAKAAGEARQRIAAKKWAEAQGILRDALDRYPGEPELAALLDSVERGLNEQETRKQKEAILGAARQLEAQGKDAEALAKLDEGLAAFAGDPELGSARAALAGRIDEKRRSGDISARVARISQAIEAGQFDAAKRELDEAVRQLGDQPNLRRLAEDLDVKRGLAELDATARAIEQLLEKGSVTDARQRLAAALAAHPRDARLLRLQQSVDSETVFVEAMQRVEQQLAVGRVDLAETALRSAAGLKPNDSRVGKLTQRIAKEREKLAAERDKSLKKAQGLLAKSAFDEAAAILRGLIETNPGDSEAVRALDELNAARGAHLKRQNYAARINDLEAKRKADQPQLVKEGAAVLLAEFPGDQQARALMDWAEQRLQAIGATSIQAVPQQGISTGVKAGLALGLLIAIGGGSMLFLKKRNEAGSAWSASPDKMTFQWRQGEALPEPKQIALSSAGGAVTLKATSNSPWLTVDPAQTATPGQFAVAITPTGMAPGEYKGRVTIESPEAAPKSRTVDVTFKVNARPTQPVTPAGNSLSADTDLLTFEVRQGATLSDSKLIRVRGTGVTRVTVATATRGRGNWLRVSPGASALPAALSVSVSAEGLQPGPYQGEVIVTAEGAPDVVHRIPVSLRVREPERTTVPTRPVEVPKPEPVKPQPEPVKPPVDNNPPPPTPTGPYTGLRRGTFTWSGELAPGARITINRAAVTGGGNVNGRTFPGDVPINVEVPTQGIRIESAPAAGDRFSRIVLVNQSTSAISLIQIRWTVRD